MKKMIRILSFSILVPILLLAGSLALVSLLGITINLNAVRPMVEKTASTILERQVTISGPVRLLPTLHPRLEIQEIRIDNPSQWGTDEFLSIGLARIQLSLPDLLQNRLNIPEITAEEVKVFLESREDNVNNWSFDTSTNTPPSPTPPAAAKEETRSHLSFMALQTLSFKDIEVHYKDVMLNREIIFHLDELSGEAPANQPTRLHFRGRLQDKAYSFSMEAGAINTFAPKKQAWPFSLSGDISGTPFTASGNIGLQDNENQIFLETAVGSVDIGKLLSWLNLAENISASTQELHLQLSLKGKNLHEILQRSEFQFTLSGGSIDLGGGKETEFLITNVNGTIGAQAGEQVLLKLDGTIESTPVTITVQGMPLMQYVTAPGEIPISMEFVGSGLTLQFDGAAALPIGSKTFSLNMHAAGETLSSLNDFLHVDLPPLGPYSLTSRFSTDSTGFELSKLQVNVGASELTGKMRINKESTIPEVTVQLQSPLLQIDDFTLADWSPDGKSTADSGKEEETEQDSPSSDQKKRDIPAMLSPESLARFNASLSIQVEKVLSGKDLLGNAELHVALQDGHFTIDPLHISLPEGDARLDFSFYPTTADTKTHISLSVDNLDLGVIAHRTRPESTMGGVLNLAIDLNSTAPTLADLMAYANGTFDLAFVPVNFDANMIDLWAANLLAALASEMDDRPKSSINCLVASFVMEDGLMQERTIFMDTSHMSIEGEVNINFQNETVKLKMTPKAKKPEFFSLAIPVKVQGTFKEFGISINAIRLSTSLASFLTSPVHVPLRRILGEERPEDGREACVMAWKNRNVDKQEPGTGD